MSFLSQSTPLLLPLIAVYSALAQTLTASTQQQNSLIPYTLSPPATANVILPTQQQPYVTFAQQVTPLVNVYPASIYPQQQQQQAGAANFYSQQSNQANIYSSQRSLQNPAAANIYPQQQQAPYTIEMGSRVLNLNENAVRSSN